MKCTARRAEMIKMALFSLMKDLSEEEKLDFLTEVFLITEDIRHELSFPDENVEEVPKEPLDLERAPIAADDCSGEWTL